MALSPTSKLGAAVTNRLADWRQDCANGALTSSSHLDERLWKLKLERQGKGRAIRGWGGATTKI